MKLKKLLTGIILASVLLTGCQPSAKKLTPEEIHYLAQYTKHTEVMRAANTMLEQCIDDPIMTIRLRGGNHPQTQAWMQKTGIILADLINEGDALKHIPPPSRFYESHKYVALAMTKYGEAYGDIAWGIMYPQSGALGRAADHMTEANQLLAFANKKREQELAGR